MNYIAEIIGGGLVIFFLLALGAVLDKVTGR